MPSITTPHSTALEVILIGPDVNAKGGIAASIALLEDFINSQNLKVSCISTTNPDSGFLMNFWIYLKALFSLTKRLIFSRPDIVHTHMASRGSFIRKSIICLICMLFRTPYIIHLHGGGFKDFYQSLWGLGKAYLRFVFKKSARVIVLSRFWHEWVAAELQQNHVTVVHNGVHEIVFKPGELNKASPTVLFLGLLGKNKGTDVLIDAMRIVAARIPDVVLELCGNGDIDHYKEQAYDLPNVRFLGWIDENGRRAALGRATVYCLPSWKEGLPFSILEAMSAGLPVISTPVGSIPEAVLDRVSGYLVQPGDARALASAILRILKNPNLAKKMGSAGKELQSRKFSYSAMGESCLNVYKSATSTQAT